MFEDVWPKVKLLFFVEESVIVADLSSLSIFDGDKKLFGNKGQFEALNIFGLLFSGGDGWVCKLEKTFDLFIISGGLNDVSRGGSGFSFAYISSTALRFKFAFEVVEDSADLKYIF